jgi:hypothetical protein
MEIDPNDIIEAKVNGNKSIVQLVRDANQIERHDPNWSISDLSTLIDDLNHGYSQLQVIQKIDHGGVQGLGIRVYDGVRRIMGKPTLYTTLTEVFDQNLDLMEQLQLAVNTILRETIIENERLQDLVDSSIDEEENIFKRVESLREKILLF